MKSYALSQARTDFSRLVDRALAGEPSRVTRYGKEAVVIVSEAEWHARSRAAPTLGHLLAEAAEKGLLKDVMVARPWKHRALGSDIE